MRRKAFLFADIIAALWCTASALAGEPVIKEYPVPKGSHPHDVAPARDGGVWYTAQASGELGWLDPVSGHTKHIPLGKDLKYDYVNSPHRNFFKHADRDSNASVPPLKDGNVESIVFLAVEDYLRLFGMSPVELQVYQLWYLAKNEEKLSTDAMACVLAGIRETYSQYSGLGAGRAAFYGS